MKSFTRSVVVSVLVTINSPGEYSAAADDIEATGCFLSLKEEAQVPARESGLLKEILVEPGDEVHESQVLASLEDNEIRLSLNLVQIDLSIARKRDAEAVAVDIAEAAVNESSKLTHQAQLDEQITRKMAESQIAVRQAIAASELAKDAFDRAVASREKFRTSVSSRELATVQYELDKTRMDVEQAKDEHSLQLLRADSQSVVVEQRQTAELRLQLELRQAKLEQDISALAVERTLTSVDIAMEKLDRQKMKSPLNGIVVEKFRHAGEWVEAGDPVLRVIRLDQLFVEGYVTAGLVDGSYRGHEVSVTGDARGQNVIVKGTIVFVSPEVDPVNGQVQVRAEIGNEDLRLRPGQPVQMVIRAE